VGIDRSVFPTVFNLTRQAHGMAHNLDDSDMLAVEHVFKQTSRQRALEDLRNTAL
jgi:hypothetical protein